MDEVCSCVSAKKTGHVIAEASPGWRVGRETEWLNKAKPEPSRQNESPTPCQIPSFRSLHLCCKVPQRYYFQYLLQVRHSCATRRSGQQLYEKREASFNFADLGANDSFFLSRPSARRDSDGGGVRPLSPTRLSRPSRMRSGPLSRLPPASGPGSTTPRQLSFPPTDTV